MTPTQYLEQSERTLADTFYKQNVNPNRLGEELVKRIENENLDIYKKALFYNKIKGYYPEEGERHPWTADGDSDLGYTYDNVTPLIVHGILGIDTEAQELSDVLLDQLSEYPDMSSTEATRKIVDEVGDLLWYVAVLLREHGLTFEEVMEKNIQKLAKRYPEKFDERLAVNRNDAEEQTVFEV